MRVFNVIKRAIKWYCNQIVMTSAFTPSRMIPYIKQ